jgi:3-(methylsulfanyl)propanoyl-CoA dehydrogenase
MLYGESEGAKAWLVGEENRGLAAMFVMMNAARLAVGTQGVAIGERAYRPALAFARERRQGRRPNGGDGMALIIEHADVQRMLMTMKAYVHAARGICHLTAASLDLASHGRTEEERAAGANRAALLTPIAKAFSTDVGDEAASLGVQVHGGMGFVEETGAAQHMRDSRIAAIYEGANGIHGIDLALRKLPRAGGETVRSEIAGIRAIARDVEECGAEAFGATADRLMEAADALDQATRDMHRWLADDQQAALAGASQYLRLFGLTLGGACLAKAGLAAEALAEDGNRSELGRVGLARFFAEKLLPVAPGVARAIASGAEPHKAKAYEVVLAESL